MELSLLEFLQGFFSLIFVLITVGIGLIIISKYFKTKRWEFLLIGIAWTGMASAYYADGINFIMILLYDKTLILQIYLFIATAFLVPVLFLWLFTISDIISIRNRKMVLIIFFILCATFEIILITLLIIEPKQVGIFINPFTLEFSLFTQVVLIVSLFLFVLFGFIFAKASITSEKPEIKLKGKFLLIAFISFTIGIVLDVLLPITPLSVVITRLILVSSSLEFYFGYILPNWVKKLFLKE